LNQRPTTAAARPALEAACSLPFPAIRQPFTKFFFKGSPELFEGHRFAEPGQKLTRYQGPVRAAEPVIVNFVGVGNKRFARSGNIAFIAVFARPNRPLERANEVDRLIGAKGNQHCIGQCTVGKSILLAGWHRANKCLDKLEDFEYKGEKILASRLGYRINKNFAFRCMNRLFDEPLAVFNEKMLQPELQDMEIFVDGIKNIVEAQQKVALRYFEDGSVEAAIPPLKILLHIMAYGNFEGKDLSNPELRKQFGRNYVLQTEWYSNRLNLKQEKDSAFLKNQIQYIENFKANPINQLLIEKMQIKQRLEKAKRRLQYVESQEYTRDLIGTIGADSLFMKK